VWLYNTLTMWWHKCRYQLLSSGQMDKSIYVGRGVTVQLAIGSQGVHISLQPMYYCWRGFAPHLCGCCWLPTLFSCFPFNSCPSCFCVPSHNKCALPKYPEVHCLDKRLWKIQLLICRHIYNIEQYQLHSFSALNYAKQHDWTVLQQLSVLNIKICTLQDIACEFAAHVAYNSVSYEYMPVALISSYR
jgi:hypothetical protein